MNLDLFEQQLEQSSREIFKSLGVIQELLNLEKKNKIIKKNIKDSVKDSVKETVKETVKDSVKNSMKEPQRTEYEIKRDIYPETIVYEKTPTKKRKKKKKSSFSYSTFVVDTSSSSEDEDWKNSD
tara:strand:- start:112 stop:486 length:375 start_codon:yes stop_codon:yes gene_type:complete